MRAFIGKQIDISCSAPGLALLALLLRR